MADKTSASQCWIVLSVCFLVSASEEVRNITAKPGEDVTLPCRAPSPDIDEVTWKRNEETVCVNHNHKQNWCKQQSSAFEKRVEISTNKSPSLILKNVKISDSGTYKCHVKLSGTKQSTNLPITIINLTVEPGDTDGQTGDGDNKDGGDKVGGNNWTNSLAVGLGVGLGVVLLFIVICVVACLVLKQYGYRWDSYKPPADEAGEKQQV